ncbi:MAG: hypothetical protein Q3987_04115 [Oscillospiraceae bacterium]|nr:hypothetical protein [Oscillospiraceae bacterium]
MKTVLKKLRVFRMPLLLIIILVLLWFPLAAGKGISIINGDFFLKHNWAKLANAAAFIIGLPVAVYVIFRITGAIKLNISLKSLIPNTKKYLPDVSESLLSDVENDISGGMRFLKKGQIGSLTLKRFTPVIIPVSEVVEVLYESFEGEITHLGIDGTISDVSDFYQYLFFRLRNGNYVPVLINDEDDTASSLQALREAGIETVVLNRLDMKNALMSKDKILSFIKEKERIIVRSSDSMHIIALPVSDGCVSFEKLFNDPQGRLIATAACEDGSSLKYIIDEMTLKLTKDT